MNVAIIPARGGSKRIQRKNIRPFHGTPIIAYSITVAHESGLFERIIVSTEDDEIAMVSEQYGADVLMRPRRLADDESVGTQEVTAYVLGTVPFCAFACCLYPCAPLVTAEDLRCAYAVARDTPVYVYAKGQFYFGSARRFIDTPDDFSGSVRMESPRYIDIDIEADWQRAEHLYAELHKEAA